MYSSLLQLEIDNKQRQIWNEAINTRLWPWEDKIHTKSLEKKEWTHLILEVLHSLWRKKMWKPKWIEKLYTIVKEKDLETQMNWHKQGSEGGRPRFTEQPGASSLPQTLRQSPSHPSSLCRIFHESSPTSQSSLSSLDQRRPSAKADHQSVVILTTTLGLTWKK